MIQNLSRWSLLLALLVVTACARAVAMPDGKGGFTLLTTSGNLEQAVVRFQRSGRHECPGPYTLGPPKVLNEGVAATAFGPASRMTVQTTLMCQPPS